MRIEDAEGKPSEFAFFSASDYGARVYDSKCTGGGMGAFGGNTFTFNTKAEGVSTSTTSQAEATTAKRTCHLMVWVLGLAREMRVRGQGPVVLYLDNRSVLKLSENAVLHKGSKHYRIGMHYIRDLVTRGEIKTEYLETAEMPADILTKPICEKGHEKLLAIARFT